MEVRNMQKMKINTEKFVGWLKQQIQTCKHYECEAWRKRNYEKAITLREEKGTYEFILMCITGEDDTDIGEFMEEVEE